MTKNSNLHLNCNSIIPDCGFQCSKCIDEIRLNLESKGGIIKVSLTEKEGISWITVEHNPEIMSVETLLKDFKNFPSFYSGYFVSELLEV